MLQCGRLADGPQNSHAVIARQIQIEENDTRFWLPDSRPVLMDESESLLSIVQDFQFVGLALLIQCMAKQTYLAFAIFDHQDFCGVHKSNIVTTNRFGSVGGRVQSSRPGLSRFGRKHFRTCGGLMDVERIHIAVAEDNPADVSWLKTVLDELALDYRLTVAVDGEEARDFILKNGTYRNFPPAQVIFLDMNMPKLTGLEVLQIGRASCR